MRLWTAVRPTRWFIVPADAAWPDGSDEVRDITGQHRRAVALAGLAPYAATRDEMRAWCRGERERLELRFARRRAEARARARAAVDAVSRLDQDPAKELLRSAGLDLDDPAVARGLMVALDDASAALRQAAERRDGDALVVELVGVLRRLELHDVAAALEAELL